jgi:glycosyltransferase involved in cell wall biosynthesis
MRATPSSRSGAGTRLARWSTPNSCMRLLLNAADVEIRQLGGDLTYYRDLVALSDPSLTMRLVDSSRGRRFRSLRRRLSGRLCRSWQPADWRRRLLVSSRSLDVTRAESRDADVILSHIWFPPNSRSRAKPAIWSSQGIAPERYYRFVNGGRFDLQDVVHLYRVIGARADALLIWTEDGARRVVEFCPDLEPKIAVIHAPIVGAPERQPLKPSMQDGVIRFLFVGADAQRKGLTDVVRAFREAKGADARATLTVVSRPTAAMIDFMSGVPDVRFIRSGSTVDVQHLMSESDVFVLPTRADTYALAAVEAMARGCAVVISDLPPLPEIVPNEKVGLVVAVEDVDCLTAALGRLIAGGQLLRQMQAEAHALYLSRHAPRIVRERLLQLAESLVRDASDSRTAQSR